MNIKSLEGILIISRGENDRSINSGLLEDLKTKTISQMDVAKQEVGFTGIVPQIGNTFSNRIKLILNINGIIDLSQH